MYDANLELKDAGLVASDTAGEVNSQPQIIDLGEGLVKGTLVVDVSAIEIASNDEKYKISLQGCNENDFNSGYEDLVILELGAKEVIGGDVDSEPGRYEIPFINRRNGTIYRYIREYCDVAGAIATGINFSAYINK